jgi:hypothetical protein
MTEVARNRRMILCAGLQSGGTTLVSWCFLQRRDTNGVLDMPSDVIQAAFDKVKEPIVWCKTTIASFRWLDLAELYRDLGWEPEPLLVVREVRTTYSSLVRKWYGHNGTTAEDPPLRMRFRRFLRDWELFCQEAWPILKYEDVIDREGDALQEICERMRLAWDPGMVSWPKQRAQIAYVGDLNRTFEQTMAKGSLATAKLREKAQLSLEGLPRRELEWLEETFAAYNQLHGYPMEVHYPDECEVPVNLPAPAYEGTARDWIYSEKERLERENERLVEENERLRHEIPDLQRR